MEMTHINQQMLVSSYMQYLTAHGRYLDAKLTPNKSATLAYAKREFEETHAALLNDGGAEYIEAENAVRVMLPARGAIEGSTVMDLPQFRTFIDHRQYGTGLYEFVGMTKGQPQFTHIENVELFEHIIYLNDDGAGYCLLYEDEIVSYI